MSHTKEIKKCKARLKALRKMIPNLTEELLLEADALEERVKQLEADDSDENRDVKETCAPEGGVFPSNIFWGRIPRL